MKLQHKNRLAFGFFVVSFVFLSFFSYPKLVSWFPWLSSYLSTFRVNEGLDLQGGLHLEYAADVSQIESDQREEALQAAKSVIERRVDAFGVGESLVQVSRRGDDEYRLIVELPGIRNVEGAKQMIQETPFLEFREPAPDGAREKYEQQNEANQKLAEQVLARAKASGDFQALASELSQDPTAPENKGDIGFVKKGDLVPEYEDIIFKDDFQVGTVYPELVESPYGWHIIKKEEVRGEGDEREVRSSHILFFKDSLENHPDEMYVATGLTGKNVQSVSIDYQSQGFGSPQVLIQFDGEGADLLAALSKRNVGKPLAIFIDHQLFSAPTIQQELIGGQAVVTSNFTPDTVKEYVKRLNEGALPVPITLVSQQSVDASLGDKALEQSLFAGLIGLLMVSFYMLVFYRFLGLVAVVALIFYTVLLVSIFKLSALTPFAITVTLSGIAGFVLSIGIAVDANILQFERFREELAYGKTIPKALDQAFRRAWPSIRDGHISTLITSFILIMTGTGFVKGFAIILAIGVLLSLFTAVILVQMILRVLIVDWFEDHKEILVTQKTL